jgi:multidrug efflux pump subunit AcrB
MRTSTKDRVFKLGVPIQDVYQTLQALLGGTYVNQFNRLRARLARVPRGRAAVPDGCRPT